MSIDWKSYWDRHADRSAAADPFQQVQRVENGISLDGTTFDRVAAQVVSLLDAGPEHRLLDLCCGNGLLSHVLEPYCKSILAVDFCARLLADVTRRTSGKTATLVADARKLELPPASFDRVLMAAALQHFSPEETILLFGRLSKTLVRGGLLLVTDIPDRARIWNFFDSPDRERAYFESEARSAPILGTWFDVGWLERLGRFAGFARTEVSVQARDLPYSHYRFDLRCWA